MPNLSTKKPQDELDILSELIVIIKEGQKVFDKLDYNGRERINRYLSSRFDVSFKNEEEVNEDEDEDW